MAAPGGGRDHPAHEELSATVNIDLTATTSSAINTALIEARRRYGSPASSAVLTLVIVTEEQDHYDAVKAAVEAAREHPARILVVIPRRRRGEEQRLDAEVRASGETGPGEVVILRLYGALAEHAESVVLPLLLPDAPVVTWWPNEAPDEPAASELGKLAQRRVTDSTGSEKPLETLARHAAGYTAGDTDLSWTRLTPWRTLLASALDVPFDPISGGHVLAEEDNPSAELLAVWLSSRLGVPFERRNGPGPGINEVRLATSGGDITLSRADGRVALLSRPGWPERPVALKRRSTAELLAEELRRLDEDDIYYATVRLLAGPDAAPDGPDATTQESAVAPGSSPSPASSESGETSATGDGSGLEGALGTGEEALK